MTCMAPIALPRCLRNQILTAAVGQASRHPIDVPRSRTSAQKRPRGPCAFASNASPSASSVSPRGIQARMPNLSRRRPARGCGSAATKVPAAKSCPSLAGSRCRLLRKKGTLTVSTEFLPGLLRMAMRRQTARIAHPWYRPNGAPVSTPRSPSIEPAAASKRPAVGGSGCEEYFKKRCAGKFFTKLAPSCDADAAAR